MEKDSVFRMPVYLASIALEPNRWSTRSPSFPLSEWLSRISTAGFDGVELWEYHLTRTTSDEQDVLYSQNSVPIPVYNTYVLPVAESRAAWGRVAEDVRRLGCSAVKFNLGGDPKRAAEYRDVVRDLAAEFAGNATLLCECHPGTIVEQPDEAAGFFEAEGLEDVRFIVHPFLIGSKKLRRWINALGSRIVHIHSQMRSDDDRMLLLEERRDAVRGQLGILLESGFEGSLSIEFVERTRTACDQPERTFETAIADLALLRTLECELA